MSTIVVRASDTALAMDEVERRLGPDAFILSTKTKKGQVEIRATTDAPRNARPTPPRRDIPKPKVVDVVEERPTPAKTFGEVLAERSNAFVPRDFAKPAAPVEQVKPVDGGQPVLVPDTKDRIGGWPGLSSEFVAALWSELSLPKDRVVPGFFTQLCDAVLPDGAVLPAGTAERVIVIGAQGSGKTLTVARLAAMLMTDDPTKRPRLIAPRLERQLAPDTLMGAARLMGLSPERPILKDLYLGQEFTELDPSRPQIIDLSAVTDLGSVDFEQMVIPGRTQVVMCLQSGLHPAMIARRLAQVAQFNPAVCLTRCDEWTPTPEELSAIASSGCKLGLLARGAGLLDTLSHPTKDDIRTFAHEWLTPVGGAS